MEYNFLLNVTGITIWLHLNLQLQRNEFFAIPFIVDN